MKNMGWPHLYLVAPKGIYPRVMDAVSRAGCGASDILENAWVVDALEEALAGCQLVIWTVLVKRNIPWPLVDQAGRGLRCWWRFGPPPLYLVVKTVRLTNERTSRLVITMWHIPSVRPLFIKLRRGGAGYRLRSEWNLLLMKDLTALWRASGMYRRQNVEQIELLAWAPWGRYFGAGLSCLIRCTQFASMTAFRPIVVQRSRLDQTRSRIEEGMLTSDEKQMKEWRLHPKRYS